MRAPHPLARLRGDTAGAVAIETAFVAPVMILLSLGSFEVSNVVARQSELQTALSEASAIAIAAEPTTESRRETVKSIIETSTGLPASSITVAAAYRCGNTATYITSASSCTTDRLSSYVRIRLTDVYTPTWNSFGMGEPFNFTVQRYVMIKQQNQSTGSTGT